MQLHLRLLGLIIGLEEMWGDGGRVFWERRAGGAEEGVVVMFLWPSSDEKDLKLFVDLYSSVGWSSLVCQSDFFTM